MEAMLPVDGFMPDLKYLFNNVQAPAPMQDTLKKGKLASEVVPEYSDAYLGPQIWNDLIYPDEMKLELGDLEELLGGNDLEKEIEFGMSALTPMGSRKTSLNIDAEEVDYVEKREAPCSPPVQSYNMFSAAATYSPQSIHSSANLDSLEAGSTDNGSSLEELTSDHDDSSFDYHPDITDVIISSSSVETDSEPPLFDPCKRSFSDEELKPQPIIRKAKKVYVHDENKDDKYWQKRQKNNVAAKRSREARRIKENQIAMRTKFLEKENGSLRSEVLDLRQELKRLTEVVSIYAARDAK